MTLSLLLAWWNLIYVLPFGLAAAYLGIYVFTGITFGDHDVDAEIAGDADVPSGEFGHVHVEAHVVGDADVDADADVNADADMDADHDLAADHDVDADADSPSAPALGSGSSTALAHVLHVPHVHAPSAHSPFLAFLSLLGVGKIPLSLILMILMLIWGSAGFLLNQFLAQFVTGWLIGVISLPITGIVSLTLTSLIARAVGRFLPSMETYAHRRQELVGQIGEAIYNINSTFGLVSVRDRQGDLFQVPCRTADDGPPIPKGTRVVLFDYDPDKGVFRVAPFNPNR